MSPDKLRRRALALGAELEIDGRTINAGRQQIRVVGAESAKGPEPEAYDAARDPLAVMANAMSLQAQVAAAQSEATMRVLMELADRVMSQAPAATAKPAAPAAATAPAADAAPIVMPVWFAVHRDTDGNATGLEPAFGVVPSDTLVSLDAQLDTDGLLRGIKPTYLN